MCAKPAKIQAKINAGPFTANTPMNAGIKHALVTPAEPCLNVKIIVHIRLSHYLTNAMVSDAYLTRSVSLITIEMPGVS